MEQLLGIIGLVLLAGGFLISFWRRQKKKTPRLSTPAGSIAGCESAAGLHCGQCPLGQNNSHPKLLKKGE